MRAIVAPSRSAVEEQTPSSCTSRRGRRLRAVGDGARVAGSPEVIALREMDGESYQDIAGIARCPVGR